MKKEVIAKLESEIEKTFEDITAKFEEMKEAVADLFPDGAAQSDLPPNLGPYIDKHMAALHSRLSDQIGHVHDRISQLQGQLYDHTDKGHLPPIVGAGRMQKALKAVGLDDDYDVQKKTIYANDGTPDGFSFLFKVKK